MEWCPECQNEMLHIEGNKWECENCDETFFVCPDCGDTVCFDYWDFEQDVCFECADDGTEDGGMIFILEEDVILGKLFGFAPQGKEIEFEAYSPEEFFEAVDPDERDE